MRKRDQLRMNLFRIFNKVILVAAVLLAGCEERSVPAGLRAPVLPSATAQVQDLQVTLTAKFKTEEDMAAAIEYGFYFGTDESMMERHKVSRPDGLGYSLTIENLEYSTSYFYKVWVGNGRDEQVSSLLTVQTGDKQIEPDPPVNPDPPAEGIIQFKDPAVKALCVANWDRNGDGELSVAEAADVMDLGRVFESSDIMSFNELAYFTNLRVCSFALCHKLSEVKLPDSIIQITASGFSECWELKLTSLPKNLTQIGEYAFHQCKNVRFTSLPDGLETIGWCAFAGADNIALTELPSNLISIGSVVFEGKQSVLPEDLPASLKMIGARAFGKIRNFNPKSIPSGVSEIGDGAFDGCEALSWTKLPDYLVRIGENTFRNCWHLAVTELPSGLREIGNNAFENCYLLNITELPDGLFTISDGAFKNCGIKNLSIPASVDHIGTGAFYGCYPSIVKIYASEPPKMLDTYLGNRAETIYVPKQSIQKYETAANWSKWKGKYKALSDDDTPEPPTPDEKNIQFEDSAVKAICVSNWDKDGDGELSYEEAADVRTIGSAFSRSTDIRSFKEFEYFTGLTAVPNDGFSGCKYLIDFKLPAKVIRIGNSAFSGCPNLCLTQLPDGLEDIGHSAFAGCGNIRLNSLPETLRSIGAYAFSHCDNVNLTKLPPLLTSIEIGTFEGSNGVLPEELPSGLVSIGPSAFRCITKLNLKKLPDGLTFIGLQAFEECETLALTELPSGLTTIELRAFNRCGNLKLKSLPAGITKIDEEAFAGCVSLEFTSLPEALTEIGKMAFMNCAFRQLTLPAGVVRIEEDAFKGCESMKAVNILAEDPPVMDDIYLGEYADVIRVPAASLEKYRTASGWSQWKTKFRPIAAE